MLFLLAALAACIAEDPQYIEAGYKSSYTLGTY